MTTIAAPPTMPDTDPKQLGKVRKVIESKTFATLATTSPAGRPHVAGVLYDEAERLGYASEAAFSRAYKRVTGLAPGAVRRRGPADPLAEAG